MRWLRLIPVTLAALLVAAPAWAQPRRAPARAPRPMGPAAARTGKVLDRLNRMPPEERNRILKDLPPERRKRVEEQLDRYNQLPPGERDNLRQQLDRFRDLPEKQQEAARRIFRRFNSFPEDRRTLLKDEFRHLRELEPADRRAHINSDEFRSKYTLAEQQLLQDFVNLDIP